MTLVIFHNYSVHLHENNQLLPPIKKQNIACNDRRMPKSLTQVIKKQLPCAIALQISVWTALTTVNYIDDIDSDYYYHLCLENPYNWRYYLATSLILPLFLGFEIYKKYEKRKNC